MDPDQRGGEEELGKAERGSHNQNTSRGKTDFSNRKRGARMGTHRYDPISLHTYRKF